MTELTADRALADTPLDRGPVVVTGGASGLGAAVVRAVQAAGGTPVVLDLAAPGEGTEGVAVDLADPRAAEAAVRDVAERHGGLGAVVTAAGIDACGRLADVDADRWDRVVAVNLLGTAAVVRAALPALEAARGRVVTVASTLGYRALSDATAYCASKFGVVGFSRALQVELAGRSGSRCSSRAGCRRTSSTTATPSTSPARTPTCRGRTTSRPPCSSRSRAPPARRSASWW
jgi:NAD(P)-dependent dehydrogenase (short-subunit alcohol dehydrogenase family)